MGAKSLCENRCFQLINRITWIFDSDKKALMFLHCRITIFDFLKNILRNIKDTRSMHLKETDEKTIARTWFPHSLCVCVSACRSGCYHNNSETSKSRSFKFGILHLHQVQKKVKLLMIFKHIVWEQGNIKCIYIFQPMHKISCWCNFNVI